MNDVPKQAEITLLRRRGHQLLEAKNNHNHNWSVLAITIAWLLCPGKKVGL
jgi:hypothetical protein